MTEKVCSGTAHDWKKVGSEQLLERVETTGRQSNMETFLFYSLAVVLVGFSVLTVTARNPVRSAVYLISALLSIAGLFFLMRAEFVGAVQVLVYVGGIMVLFLFVILLVNVERVEKERKASRQWKAGVVLGVVLTVELVYIILRRRMIIDTLPSSALIEGRSQNTESVGVLLYTEYLLPFEIVSVLLLVAMIGAVVMARKELR